MKKYLYIISTLFLISCQSKNTAPASYVKSVVALQEGDGVMTYFSLADKDGQETSTGGKVKVIYELKLIERPDIKLSKEYADIKTVDLDIKPEDFQAAQIGKGAFEHESLILPIGRIPYKDFGNPVPWESYKDVAHSFGRVRVIFTPTNGQPIEGKANYSFD